METMLIKKMKLGLIVVVVADIIVLIFEYPTIYFIICACGWSTYNVIDLVSKFINCSWGKRFWVIMPVPIISFSFGTEYTKIKNS